MWFFKKPKAIPSRWNIKCHSHNEMWLFQKDQKDLMLWLKNGAKYKAPSYVIKSCGRSYMHTFIIEMGHMI